MEQSQNQFPHDQNNRIQKLYYDIDINTIFNRTKLQNIKNKFWKYEKYLNKKYFNDVQPKLLEFEKIRDEAYEACQRAKRISLIHDPTPENVEKRKALVPIFRKADEEYEYMKYEADFYNQVIGDIHCKLYEIKKQQRNIYKHYRKCKNCEKMNMVTISGCKSKHKLCSDCIYDKTECPVCNEDLGLVHCDICMGYKKELVDTGCKNNHQTCKYCLDKIQTKKKEEDWTILSVMGIIVIQNHTTLNINVRFVVIQLILNVVETSTIITIMMMIMIMVILIMIVMKSFGGERGGENI